MTKSTVPRSGARAAPPRPSGDLREIALTPNSLLDSALDALDEGVSIVDSALRVVAFNRRFIEILDLPRELFAPGDPFERFIRFNAERGEYGPGDVEDLVRGRMELARRFEPHRFLRSRPDGRVIEIVGRPIPGGGFITTYADATERSLSQDRIRESEARMRSTIESALDCFIVIDAGGRIIEWNQQAERTFGWSRDEALGRTLPDTIIPERFREPHRQGVRRFARTGSGRIGRRRIELTARRRDGSELPVELSILPIQEGGTWKFSAFVRDIGDAKEAQRTLHEQQERFREFAEVAADSFWETDAGHRFRYLSGRFESVTGVQTASVLGHALTELAALQPENASTWKRLQGALSGRRPLVDFEFAWQRPDGDARVLLLNARPVERDGHFDGYRGVSRDVTEAHRLQQQLSWQARHDPLTGDVNRVEFEGHLERLARSADQGESRHALCYLDLDHFKVVNDSFGHVAGDALLRQISDLFRRNVRSTDLVARLGGDEFAILMTHCPLEHAERAARALCDEVDRFRFVWEGRSMKVGISIGLVPITQEATNPAVLLSAADSACYRAKDSGRNRVHVMRSGDPVLAGREQEMNLVAGILEAIEESRFVLHYQLIEPAAGREEGGALHFEILLRMHDAEGRLLLPASFLHVAERYDLMARIDKWVVDSTLEFLGRAAAAGHRVGLCSMNLSGQSLGGDDLVEFISERLGHHHVAPQQVCFEVTETAAISNLSRAAELIGALRSLGCRFALDDFGSGLSSFGYLRSLPVDFLKIDGAFVRGIISHPVELEMLHSINHLGHVMGKQTIAEYAETPEIRRKLHEIGIDYVQGYAIAHPAPVSKLC